MIPTYNERENIVRIVPQVLRQGPEYEVLVIDDGSPDGTGKQAQALSRKHARAHVLHRPGKMGLGAAYLAGFRWGLERDYDILVQMDADFSHPPDMLPALVEACATSDVAVGSRYVGGRVAVVNWPRSRVWISRFGSFYARVVTGLPVADATGGFNALRRGVLENLDLRRLRSTGYSFQIELKYRAWRAGHRIREVPFQFVERDVGESKMTKAIIVEAVWRMWLLRLERVRDGLRRLFNPNAEA